jgi:hypothetical protein
MWLTNLHEQIMDQQEAEYLSVLIDMIKLQRAAYDTLLLRFGFSGSFE